MDRLAILLLFSSLLGCSTLMSAGAAGAGAAIGSLAGPGGAAIGAAGGVVAVELIEDEAPVESIPVDGPAATVHQVDNLINSVGLWYLLIFVLVPLVSKKGRTWLSGFLNSAPKKWVSENWERLNKIEEAIVSPKSRKRK